MLTPEDIQLIITAEKEVFPTKTDFDDLRQDFGDLQTSVDNYAKKTDTYHQELAVYKDKVNRLEEWVKQAAVKLGVNYNP